MKVYLDSVGCRLNQAEIEGYARQFRSAGFTLVETAQEADVAVINTCTVTSAAASDSRGKIRKAGRVNLDELIVTGCLSTMEPGIVAALPGVTRIISNHEKDHLVSKILDVPVEEFDLEPLQREIIPGVRFRTRAFIKVQDGCDNRCAFCVTTLARGSGRSRTETEVIADVEANMHSAPNQSSEQVAAKEIVITGVHLGSWGRDLTPPKHLKDLLLAVLENTDIPRLRVSSLEPWDLDGEFFALWENPRLCPHLHLPLQSGSAATLRRMARKTTPQEYASLVDAARKLIPQAAITTDVITGYPGETRQEFEESLAFVREMNFSAGHVFTYSTRPGTAAAEMPDHVPYQLRKERNARMREVFDESAQLYRKNFIGRVMPVLWESATALDSKGWKLSGLTDNYLRVHTNSAQRIWNQITPVLMENVVDGVLVGQLQ